MKIKKLLSVCFLFLLASCYEGNVYHQFDNMAEDNRWMPTDAKTFEFTIENDTSLYDITFEFSHVYDYQFAGIPINFSIESPDEKKENFNTTLLIKNGNGKDLGDCSGDVCDLKTVIREKAKLQKGTYKITVSHSFQGPYLPNVLGIGLSIDKVQ